MEGALGPHLGPQRKSSRNSLTVLAYVNLFHIVVLLELASELGNWEVYGHMTPFNLFLPRRRVVLGIHRAACCLPPAPPIFLTHLIGNNTALSPLSSH
jgi:hypothetical protein